MRPSIAERIVTGADQFSALSVNSAQVHVRHRNQAPFPERTAPPLAVFEFDRPQQHAAAQIELLAVGQDPDRSLIVTTGELSAVG